MPKKASPKENPEHRKRFEELKQQLALHEEDSSIPFNWEEYEKYRLLIYFN